MLVAQESNLKMVPAIIIEHHICTRCSKCIKSCPADILVRQKSKSKAYKFDIEVTDAGFCFECRACEVVCPENCIHILCSTQAP
ncbi:MAG: 4Fe-4S dicluster domain-containing protein [Candidatus Thorarchaeota archaeon]